MSEDPQVTDAANAGGVSKARKAFSTILLLALTVVLAIEVRAAVGHTWTGAVLADKSENGVFPDTKFEEVKGLLKLWPSEEIINDTEQETEYRYSWYSLLRPLLNKPEAEYFLVKAKFGETEAVVFDIQLPNRGERAKLFHAMGRVLKDLRPSPTGLGTESVSRVVPGFENGGSGRQAPSGAARQRPMLEDADAAEETETEATETEEPKTEEPKTEK